MALRHTDQTSEYSRDSSLCSRRPYDHIMCPIVETGVKPGFMISNEIEQILSCSFSCFSPSQKSKIERTRSQQELKIKKVACDLQCSENHALSETNMGITTDNWQKRCSSNASQGQYESATVKSQSAQTTH